MDLISIKPPVWFLLNRWSSYGNSNGRTGDKQTRLNGYYWDQAAKRFWDYGIHYMEIAYRRVLGAVSIRKTVLLGMAIPMLKIRRPNGRLIFNMEIAIRR